MDLTGEISFGRFAVYFAEIVIMDVKVTHPRRDTMANFKRKGPKSTRAGCLLCKPHKRQGQRLALRLMIGERRRLESARTEMTAFRAAGTSAQ